MDGIGAAIAALALAWDGASVAVNYVSDSSAARAGNVTAKTRSYGFTTVAVRADIATPEGAQSLVEQTLPALETDRIDILGRVPHTRLPKRVANACKSTTPAGPARRGVRCRRYAGFELGPLDHGAAYQRQWWDLICIMLRAMRWRPPGDSENTRGHLCLDSCARRSLSYTSSS